MTATETFAFRDTQGEWERQVSRGLDAPDHPGLCEAVLLQTGFDTSFSNPKDSFSLIFQWNFA